VLFRSRAERFGQFLDQVRILARLTEFSAAGKRPAAKGERWIGRPIRTGRLKAQVWIALEKDLDLGSVTQRLEKLRGQKRKFIASLTGKLDEKDFIGRAPEEVIVRERQKLADAGWELERLEELLEKIKEP
jgi:valyl-tRNA synthetase